MFASRRLGDSPLSVPRLFDLFPAEAEELLQVRGLDLLETLGLEAIREVVKGVLGGVNVRSATEALTRRRLALLNAGLITAYLRGQRDSPNFVEGLAQRAHREHKDAPSEHEKVVLRWMLGLTKKQVQNVLRSEDRAWDLYVSTFAETIAEAAARASDSYGPLADELQLVGRPSAVDWQWALYLTTAIGAQTLGVRGSEKSLYGKFFEKLVLGGVLHVLGFSLVPEGEVRPNAFWLSSRGAKRECDATAIVGDDALVRFDIGFIGPGNSEISLDKVSRFERTLEIRGKVYYSRTMIIVDRIGKRSRVVEQAAEIDGTIIQMSGSFWPQTLGDELSSDSERYVSPLTELTEPELTAEISTRIDSAPFEEILEIAVEAAESESVDGVDADETD
jgi:hypothetical protein